MFLKIKLISPFKPVLMLVLLTTAVSCAVAPGGDGGKTTGVTPRNTSNEGDIRTAFDAYQKRDFSNAYNAYERAAGSADSRTERLAHLGKALVHLSTDAQWRDVNKAALSLQAAESVDGAADVSISMLINSVSSLIGVEADITTLNRQASNASAELGRLKEERDGLIAEQQRLNEALERLKTLTIGN